MVVIFPIYDTYPVTVYITPYNGLSYNKQPVMYNPKQTTAV